MARTSAGLISGARNRKRATRPIGPASSQIVSTSVTDWLTIVVAAAAFVVGVIALIVAWPITKIVMGPVLGVPVNKLYSAAFGPGFLLAAVYITYCMVRSYMNPALGPAVPKEERVTDIGLLLKEAVLSVVPLVGLIAATLGTILAGLATATEAAACGAFGATLLALVYGKLSWKAVVEASRSTMLTSCMVLFLVMASNVFGAVFVQTGASNVLSNVKIGRAHV